MFANSAFHWRSMTLELVIFRRPPQTDAVNTLKIDRMFVRNVVSDPDDAIVAATISMAHNIGLRAVAEGVETNAQLVHLTRMGCDQLKDPRLQTVT